MRLVKVHVDKIVISGIRVDDERRFAMAFEAELARALQDSTSDGMTVPAGDRERVRTDARVERNAGAGQIGACLARRIGGVLTR
jgi:hypothetical protein